MMGTRYSRFVGGFSGLGLLMAGLVGCDRVTITSVAVGELRVVPSSATLARGESRQLSADVTDASGRALAGVQVTWVSSNPAVVGVSTQGVVHALAMGTAAITATAAGVASSAVVSVGAPPSIQLSSTTLTYVTAVAGPAPPAQSVGIENGGGGTLDGLAVSVEYEAGGATSWIGAGIDGTRAPAFLTVTADPQALDAGIYRAKLIVSATASDETAAIDVTLRVQSLGPSIAIDQDTVFLVLPGGVTRGVAVSNAGGGTLEGLRFLVRYEGPGGWLGAFLDRSEAPATLFLTPTNPGLAPGEYRAVVELTATGLAGPPVEVGVTLQVGQQPAALLLTPAAVFLQTTAGVSPPQTSVGISNSGSGTLTGLAASVSYGAGQPGGWLTVQVAGASAPTTMVLSASTLQLPQGTYDASVEVQASAGNSPQYLPVRLTVGPPGPAVPAPPSGLAAAAVPPDQVDLTWTDGGPNETDVRVERRQPGGAWTEIALLPANTVGYRDTGVTPGADYEYQVRACNAVGCSAYSPSARVTVPAPTLPNAPSALTATLVGPGQIGLSWSDNSSDEASFMVQRADGLVGAWKALVQLPADRTTYVDKSAKRGTFYAYRVTACNPVGCSAFSNLILVLTP